jgi:hypothetical protein
MPDGQQTVADIRYADSGFFATLRVRLLRGALFPDRAASRGRPRVVIDDTLASALWPGQDPIGRDISLVLYGGITGEVVGVVAGVHLFDARTSPRPAAYLSAAEFPSDLRDLVVRADGSTAGMIASLRSAAAALDPTLPLYQIATLPELVSDSMAGERFTTILLGAFAVVALTLAGVGVFGVFSGDVARRRKEIGIRVALGARKSGVVLLVLRQAMQRAAVGVVAGAILALFLARGMASLLFGVVASDPVSFAVTGILVLGLAAVATLIPTLRALACSPVATLRES